MTVKNNGKILVKNIRENRDRLTHVRGLSLLLILVVVVVLLVTLRLFCTSKN